jgi:hypothetical protein
MSSQLNDQAAVRVDEVVLVGKKLDVLGAGIGAHEDHEVFVSAGGWSGYLAAEVAVDVFPGTVVLSSLVLAAGRLLFRALEARHVGHASFGTLGFVSPSTSKAAWRF